MTTKREASNFIRFQLEQLAIRNAHHDFEHICRQYARTRIDASVVPATGPVSKGGDQARDFESLLVFDCADSEGQRNVFACTLQSKNLFTKLKTDLGTIAAAGGVKAIYFFCVADVPVSERHKWQLWALQERGLALDVIDGQALSEHLADADLTWIAEEYLGISQKHLPQRRPQESPYEKLWASWEDPDREIASFDDFMAVRFGIRITTRAREHAPDAPKWLRLMRRFSENLERTEPIWRRAAYEFLVGSFHHKQDIEGGAPLVRAYMSALSDNRVRQDPHELRDLFTIACSALAVREPEIDIEDVRAWHHDIATIAADSLEFEERPSHRCGFFEVQYLLASFGNGEDGPDLRAAVAALQEIIRLSNDAHFYDYHALAEAVSMAAHMYAERADFELATRALDDIVAKRFGGAAAAQLCAARATSLGESSRLGASIRELHKAKLAWFSGESLESCLDSFRILSLMYSYAGLHLAGLHYAQAGLYMAAKSSKVEAVASVVEFSHLVADCRYQLGQSYEFIQVAGAALTFGSDSESAETTFARYLTTLALIDQIEPRLSSAIRTQWDEHPMRESFRDEYNMSIARVMAKELAADSTSTSYLTDCGRDRVLRWNAYASEWCVICQNRRAEIEAAEEIAALLQILQADMFDRDPWHHLGEIRITVRVEGKGEHLRFVQHGASVDVSVGEDWAPVGPEQVAETISFLAAAVFVKRDPAPDLEASLKGGLLAKAFVVAPYYVLRRAAMLGNRVRVLQSKKLSAAAIQIVPEPHQDFQLSTFRIAGHSGPEWDEEIAHRYQQWTSKLGPSLRALRSEPVISDKVAAWRAQGEPDWHIVGALGSALLTAAFVSEYGEEALRTRPGEVLSFFEGLPNGEKVYRLQPEMLLPEALDDAIEHYLAAFLTSQGVHVGTESWDPQVYRRFAEQRLGFAEHGPPAPDWFGELG